MCLRTFVVERSFVQLPSGRSKPQAPPAYVIIDVKVQLLQTFSFPALVLGLSSPSRVSSEGPVPLLAIQTLFEQTLASHSKPSQASCIAHHTA